MQCMKTAPTPVFSTKDRPRVWMRSELCIYSCHTVTMRFVDRIDVDFELFEMKSKLLTRA